jgi:tetratricopeptide (TPR) repeat protein
LLSSKPICERAQDDLNSDRPIARSIGPTTPPPVEAMTEHDSFDADATPASPRRGSDQPAVPPPSDPSDAAATLANRWPREGGWEKPVSPTALLDEQHTHITHAGRYRILGEIGRGGMGVVLRGHDPDIGRDLAIKVQLTRADANVYRRFNDGRFDMLGVASGYETAFRACGVDVRRQTVEQAVALVRSRPVWPQLVASLEDWASLNGLPEVRRKYLMAIVRKVAPDPALDPLREALANRDMTALEKLAVSVRVEKFPPGNLVHLAEVLTENGRLQQAAALLARACEQYPSDFWINHQYAYHLTQMQPPQLSEAARYFSAAAALRPDSPGVYVNLSNVLHALNRPLEAVAAAHKAVALKEDYAEAHGNLGNDLAALNRDEEAAQAYRRALKYKPELQQAKLGLTWLEYRAGRFARAERLAHEVLQAEPHSPLVLGARGEALVALGRFKEAIVAFREALKFNPQHIHLRLGLTEALFSQKNYAEAAQACQHLLDIQPAHGPALKRQGLAYYNLGDHARAAACFRTARMLQPDDLAVAGNLALALLGVGALDEARRLCEQLLQAADNPVANFVLGRVHFNQGRYADAADCFQVYVQKRPAEVSGHHSFGQALFHLKQFEPAVVALEKAVELRGDDDDYYWLGKVLRAAGRYDPARKALERAVRLNDHNAWAHLERGLLLQQIGKRAEALSALRQVLSLKPTDTDLLANLGSALANLGRAKEALPALETAMYRIPRNASCRYSLGTAYRVVGEREKAETLLREAVRLDPNFAEAHCNLGLLLEELGRYREALAAMQRGHALGSKRPNWPSPSAKWLRRIERGAEVEERLPGILSGRLQPASEEERLRWALFCQQSRRYSFTATELFATAFAARPELAGKAADRVRFRAACAAADAGCGTGADSAGLTNAQRLRCRQRALDWLRAELAEWSQLAAKSAAGRIEAQKALAEWKKARSLTGVRDVELVEELPERARADWKSLWEEVEKLLQPE